MECHIRPENAKASPGNNAVFGGCLVVIAAARVADGVSAFRKIHGGGHFCRMRFIYAARDAHSDIVGGNNIGITNGGTHPTHFGKSPTMCGIGAVEQKRMGVRPHNGHASNWNS